MATTDSAFTGSIPDLYDRHLGPLLFEPYAAAVAERATRFEPGRILETAAGTGIVTQALHRALPRAEIVATDLNPGMVAVAERKVTAGNVRFQQSDAQQLPFDDGSFDLVVCQFGVMFFPDKVAAHREARRVLADGGHYVTILWDSIDSNPASRTAQDALIARYPDDPPLFLERTPFGYHDPNSIRRDLTDAGFADVTIETVALSGRAPAAREAAIGLCQGSPLRSEIEARDPHGLDAATDAVERALGDPLDPRLSALIVTATR